MKAAIKYLKALRPPHLAPIVLLLLITALPADAATQLLLSRSEQSPETRGEYKGVVELSIDPGFDDARVSISVDGQQIASALPAPYRVTVDFGPLATQHKIAVTATSRTGKRRTQWVDTINRGMLPLSVRVKPVDLSARIFEAKTTSPADDPVETVQLWHLGQVVVTSNRAPHRFELTQEQLDSGLVQVTARTKSGDEAADFWTPSGDLQVETLQVRNVPIFVSVTDRNGVTQEKVDRSLFRILDNGAEAKIVEFGKAFDQPIAIALLLDSSASMTYSMTDVTKAAREFVKRTLKDGDQSTVYAVQDVPRRKQSLTSDHALIETALDSLRPMGDTALYDAIGSAVRELQDVKVRRAMVVLTDGADTASIATFEETKKVLARAGIPVYFIVYDTGDTDTRNVDRLKYLATDTGGFVAVATQHDLLARYKEIENDLRAQFAITYQISDYKKQNEWRNVRVQIASPQLTARTIKGYFTP